VRPVPNPISQVIFPSEDDRPDRKQYVVQCDCNYGREFAASEDPSRKDGKKGLEPGERRESPKHAHRNTAGNGMRCIPQCAKMSPKLMNRSFRIPVQIHEDALALIWNQTSVTDAKPDLFIRQSRIYRLTFHSNTYFLPSECRIEPGAELLAKDRQQGFHDAVTFMNVPPTRIVLAALFLLLMAAVPTNAFDTIVIDPGHGGNDEGTAWYHVNEKDVTLAVARRLEKLLQKSGIKCVMTRSTDTYVSLDERVEIANRQSNSLLVSIHFNGSSNTSTSGFSSYYFSQSPSGRFVAQTIQEALAESHGTPDRGIGAQNYAVLVRTLGSAVLVECGFLSNKAEATNFASAEGQQWLAEALLLGIIRANAVVVDDPPETQIAKCEVYAKLLEQKEHHRRTSAAPGKSATAPKLASKKE